MHKSLETGTFGLFQAMFSEWVVSILTVYFRVLDVFRIYRVPHFLYHGNIPCHCVKFF